MKTLMRGLYLFIAFAMLLGIAQVFTTLTDARITPHDETTKEFPSTIHALLAVMDSDPRHGNRYETDYKRVNGLLQAIDTETICTLDVRYLRPSGKKNDQPTRARILDWIKNVNPEPNDVVFIYFAGHGSKSDTSGLEDDGTYLQVRSGKLARKDIVDALEESDARNCRLRILITDSCSGKGRGEAKTVTSTLEYGHGKAFADLFIRHEGFLHLASASPGEVAFGDLVNGGWFTDGLTVSILADRSADTEFIGWNQIFNETSEHVQMRLQKMRKLHIEGFKKRGIRIKQTPKDYSLPKRVTDPEKWLTGRGKTDNMVRIAAGNFRMGTGTLARSAGKPVGNKEEIFIADKTAQPVHSVYLDAFFIDTHEVTLGDYNKFLNESSHDSELPEWVDQFCPTEEHPVVGVSWHDAMAYAKWAGKRLPTEAEWEKAARGGLVSKAYPWGNESPNSLLVNLGTQTRLVGSLDPNPDGLYDMGGNVAEWCLDPWDPDFYANSPKENPFPGQMTIAETIFNYKNVQGNRVVRGGAVAALEGSTGIDPFVGMRNKADSVDKFSNIGFRCAMDAR